MKPKITTTQNTNYATPTIPTTVDSKKTHTHTHDTNLRQLQPPLEVLLITTGAPQPVRLLVPPRTDPTASATAATALTAPPSPSSGRNPSGRLPPAPARGSFSLSFSVPRCLRGPPPPRVQPEAHPAHFCISFCFCFRLRSFLPGLVAAVVVVAVTPVRVVLPRIKLLMVGTTTTAAAINVISSTTPDRVLSGAPTTTVVFSNASRLRVFSLLLLLLLRSAAPKGSPVVVNGPLPVARRQQRRRRAALPSLVHGERRSAGGPTNASRCRRLLRRCRGAGVGRQGLEHHRDVRRDGLRQGEQSLDFYSVLWRRVSGQVATNGVEPRCVCPRER